MHADEPMMHLCAGRSLLLLFPSVFWDIVL